jgi:hypothetical protein
MTVMTYTHVIRELKGEPRVSAEEQIEQARRDRRGPRWTLTRLRRPPRPDATATICLQIAK